LAIALAALMTMKTLIASQKHFLAIALLLTIQQHPK
jgi:hypothetical protein